MTSLLLARLFLSRSLIAVAALLCCSEAAVSQTAIPFVRPIGAALRATPIDIVRQQRIEIATPRDLADPQRSQVLRLDIFPDVTVRALRQRLAPTASGVSWTGTLEGYPDSSVVFVLVGNELVGNLYTPFGFFRIQRDTDGSYLVQQVDQRESDPQTHDALPVLSSNPDVAPGGRIRPTAVDDGQTIDLMVSYTSQALAGFGSDDTMRASIDLAVASTNEAFLNSGLNVALRLVHAGVVEYEESGDPATDNVRQKSTADGFLDDLHNIRKLYAADLVLTIVESSNAGTCGSGYVQTQNFKDGTFGFAVVKRSCLLNGRSFAHELGHTLGLNHNWYDLTAGGAVPSAKGYVSVEGRFLDVMGIANLCTVMKTTCAQLLQYSNPRISRDGRPTGVPIGTDVTCPAGNPARVECDADAATTLVAMAPTVANYRDSQTGRTVFQLAAGASIRSANGQFRLTFGTDGNLVVSDDRDKSVLWSSGTGGGSAGRVTLQRDGNLIATGGDGAVLWSSQTSTPGSYVVLQDDGDLIIYSPYDQTVWSSFAASALSAASSAQPAARR